jgi:hypothetical protein
MSLCPTELPFFKILLVLMELAASPLNFVINFNLFGFFQGGDGQRSNWTKRRRIQKKGKKGNPVAANHCLLSGAERQQTDICCHDPGDGVTPHRPLPASSSTNIQGAAGPTVE